MPRPKQQTREERLEKRRLYERRRKERIKSNEVSREEFLRKDRERYARRKAAGLIVSRHEITPKELKILRRKNKISAAAYYERKKNRAAPAPVAARTNPLDETIGDLVKDESDNSSSNQSDNNGPGLSTSCHSSFLPSLRRSLRLNSNSISTKIQIQRSSTTEARSFHRVYASSPRQTPLSTYQNFVDIDYSNPGPSTSRQGNPASSRRCLPMNSDSIIGSNIQHHIGDNVVTGTHCVQITCPPNRSSIESTSCPNSPVSDSSITSVEFKRGLKDRIRKYQRTKTELINYKTNYYRSLRKKKCSKEGVTDYKAII